MGFRCIVVLVALVKYDSMCCIAKIICVHLHRKYKITLDSLMLF